MRVWSGGDDRLFEVEVDEGGGEGGGERYAENGASAMVVFMESPCLTRFRKS